jgi:hypothetical protein
MLLFDFVGMGFTLVISHHGRTFNPEAIKGTRRASRSLCRRFSDLHLSSQAAQDDATRAFIGDGRGHLSLDTFCPSRDARPNAQRA